MVPAAIQSLLLFVEIPIHLFVKESSEYTAEQRNFML